MSKNKLIPELRFPEFENEGEWDEKRISELGDTINGLTGKSGDDFGNGRPYVTYKQVFDNSIIDFENCGKVQISSNENQNTLQKGDILFTTSSETPNEVGFASALLNEPEEPTYLNSFCFSLRPFNIEEIQPVFSRYLFHSPAYRKSVTTIAQGSTRYNISKGAFLNLKVAVPKPQEQQKIAACLSSLDELIAAHSQKLDLLKDHKKGLMQNLFPQEGEKVPKYRFKKFEKDGEWEVEVLGDVIKYFKGFAFQSIFYTSSGRRIIRVSDMGFDYIKNEENAIYINEGDAKQYEKWQLKKDDLIITTVGSKPPMYDSLVGRTIIVESKDENTLLNQNAVCLRANSKIEQGFLNTLSKKSEYVNFIETIIRGNANQGSIALEDLFKYNFLKPKNPKEQKKIASCLSSLDALITAQAEKIEQLKLHKKGLMQGLFPKLND
jgi:type I restriction enzyme S subunit